MLSDEESLDGQAASESRAEAISHWIGEYADRGVSLRDFRAVYDSLPKPAESPLTVFTLLRALAPRFPASRSTVVTPPLPLVINDMSSDEDDVIQLFYNPKP